MIETDYITRNDASHVLCMACGNAACDPDECSFNKAIQDVPAADVRPAVRGEWVECDWVFPSHGFVEHHKNAAWKCPVCRNAFKKQTLLVKNFCPNCGADMRPREENADAKS